MKKLVIVLGAVLAAAPFASAEVVRINGSTTIQKRVLEPGQEALLKATGVKLEMVGNGTGNGLADLVADKCDASGASEELKDAVESMKAATGKDAPDTLQPHIITTDVIKVIVNPANPVTKLSKEQLKELNTGKIDSWKGVGGTEPTVTVITSHSGSATRKVFQKQIMDNEPYAAGAIEVKTTREEVDNVGQLSDAIGAVSMGFVNLPGNKEKVKVVETDEISRPLMLITKGDPSPAVKKVIDFFLGEGKKYIKD